MCCSSKPIQIGINNCFLTFPTLISKSRNPKANMEKVIWYVFAYIYLICRSNSLTSCSSRQRRTTMENSKYIFFRAISLCYTETVRNGEKKDKEFDKLMSSWSIRSKTKEWPHWCARGGWREVGTEKWKLSEVRLCLNPGQKSKDIQTLLRTFALAPKFFLFTQFSYFSFLFSMFTNCVADKPCISSSLNCWFVW